MCGFSLRCYTHPNSNQPLVFGEEGMANHSSVLAWRISMDKGAWKAAVHGVTKSGTQLK